MPSVSSCRPAMLCATLFFAAALPVSAAPGQATLVAPSGEVAASTVVFTWNSVPESTWYLFWIGTPAAAALQQWYTADQARCAGGGTCSITLTLGIMPGPYNWYIQTWNPSGAGPWSFGMGIALRDSNPVWNRKLPDDRRFTLVFDGVAVLDNETGLTWERAPTAGTVTYIGAVFNACMLLNLGGRKGWRVPTIYELSTLLEPSQSPMLPAGHPFTGDLSGSFWSQTTWVDTANMLLGSLNGGIIQAPKSQMWRVWCVRGQGNDRLQ